MKYFRKYSIFESLKKAQEIAAQYKIDPDDKNLVWITDMLGQQHAKYLPLFIKLLKEYQFNSIVNNNTSDLNQNSINSFKELINKTIQYKLNIQQSGVDINKFDSIEKLYDFFKKIEEGVEIKKIKNMMPKQVRDLMVGQDKRFDNLLLYFVKGLQSNKYTLPEVKEFLFNKISRNKTAEDLFKHIKGFIDGVSGEYTVNSIKDKIRTVKDAELIHTDDTTVIARIKTFEAAQELGKETSWCISQEPGHFKHYVGLINKQYFIWDLTKDRDDPMSMIGATVIPNGYISACHSRNDEPIDPSEIKQWEQYITIDRHRVGMKDYHVSFSTTHYYDEEFLEEHKIDVPTLKATLDGDMDDDTRHENLAEFREKFKNVFGLSQHLLKLKETGQITALDLSCDVLPADYEPDIAICEYLIDIEFRAQDMQVAVHFVEALTKHIEPDGIYTLTMTDDNGLGADDPDQVTEQDRRFYLTGNI